MGSYHTSLGRIEVQTDGAAGSAGWVHLDLIEDAELSMDRTSSKKPRRGKNFITYLLGMIDMGLTAAITWDDADATIAAMESAFIAGTHIGIKFMDKASGRTLTADFLIKKWGLPQPDDATQMIDSEFVPYDAGTDPVLS